MASTPSPNTHRPELDGVRGLAVALVVAAHTGYGPFGGGGVTGLVLFFALSGYLITSNLLRERHRSGRVRLGRFYLRRARRLFPALFTMLAVAVALGWVSPGGAAWSATYLGNWIRALGVADLGNVGHTWSLAVEEQFYLVMPMLVAAVPLRRLRVGLAFTSGAVMIWRAVLWLLTGDAVRVEFGFDTRADAIILGCLLAGSVYRPGGATTAAAVATMIWVTVASPAIFTVGMTVAALAAVVIVAHAATRTSWLAHPVMAWLGTRSYGIYLWHAPLLWWGDTRGRDGADTIVLLALTALLAEASYRFIEVPLRVRQPVPAEAAALA